MPVSHAVGPVRRCVVALVAAVAAVCSLLTPQAHAQGTWVTHEWEPVCDVAEDCQDAGAVFAEQLQRAAQWLDGLGFREPVLERSLRGDWRVILSRERADDLDALGFYQAGARELVLHPTSYFAVGRPGEAPDGSAQRRKEGDVMFVAVHELFHAIQEAYVPELHEAEHAWIFEGTADAIARAYADHVDGELAVLLGTRMYDEPIHRPHPSLGTLGPYYTWYFWRTLGQELGASDDVAYLADLMQVDLVPHAGVSGLDRFLGPSGGLHAVLPRVFRRMSAAGDFGEQLDWTVRSGADGAADDRLEIAVRELAARSLRLRLEPAGSHPVVAHLAFEEDRPELHLVADGALRNGLDVDDRNAFSYVLLGGEPQELDVLVVNVAEEAHRSQEVTATLQVRFVPLACPDGSGDLEEITRERTGIACLELDVGGVGPTGVSVAASRPTAPLQPADEHARFSFVGANAGQVFAFINGHHEGGEVRFQLSMPAGTGAGAFFAGEKLVNAEATVWLSVPGQSFRSHSSGNLLNYEIRIARYDRYPWGWIVGGDFEGDLCCWGSASGSQRASGRFHIVQTCGPGKVRDPDRDTCRVEP